MRVADESVVAYLVDEADEYRRRALQSLGHAIDAADELVRLGVAEADAMGAELRAVRDLLAGISR